jgi:hypothetical protein
MVASVNAGYDWATYGNSYTPISNAQFSSAISRFDLGISQINTSVGMNYSGDGIGVTAYQPLVREINGTGFLIFPVGNYIRIYNKYLVLDTEFYAGRSLTQIDSLDFFGDGTPNDIADIVEYNETLSSFRVFSFDINYPYSVTKTFEYNFTGDSNKSYTGLRHSGKDIYFLNHYQKVNGNYSIDFVKINSSTTTSVALPNNTIVYREPLAWADINDDGQNEFLTFADNKGIVFDSSGNIIFNYTFSFPFPSGVMTDARFYHPEASNIWKIIFVGEYAGGNINYDRVIYINVFRPDGTSYWSKQYPFKVYGGSLASGSAYGKVAIADYNGDYYDDIFLFGLDTTLNPASLFFRVIKGDDGSVIESYNVSKSGWGALTTTMTNPSLTIAKLNNTNYDFISANSKGGIIILDPFTNLSMYESNPSNNLYSCIPADINVDGFQEVICSGGTYTQIINGGGTNQNSVINSVAYDPSLVLSVGENVNAIINATDPEGDSPLVYGVKCFVDDNFTTSSSSTKTCSYDSVGVYNLTIGVRDPYHSDYNYFSQLITVTSTGFICNNNGICELNLGETYSNCPNDCFSNQSQTQQSSETGGSALPTQIVDVNNVNQGLLPEVYFGTIGFLSNTIQPMIILIFMIFFVLIILAIAFIIKKVGSKVSDLSR